MKIVQTFWSGNQTAEHYLHNKAGWLSAEYHWMSWALSILQLRNFYDDVELITDDVGKHILIDVLKLPYTSVRTDLQTVLTSYPNDLWALAKIFAYSLQKEPFLHIDGDVYIWKKFDSHIEKADLVAQNFEISFPFYSSPLKIMEREFLNVPACMLDELAKSEKIYSSNAGVMGGNKFDFFETFKQEVFDFIDCNHQNLDKVPYNHINICVEQFYFYCLSKQKNIEISYVINNEGQFDPTYPGFANFQFVPYQTWYIHLMAEYKRQEVVVRHLAKRLQKDYPSYYYAILKICQNAGLTLHNQVYNLPELSPRNFDYHYFEKIRDNFQSFDLSNPCHGYGKAMASYKEIEKLFSNEITEILQQKIVLDIDTQIIEELEPQLKQKLIVYNLIYHLKQEFELDNLGMILHDAFSEPKMILDGIKEMTGYFENNDIMTNFDSFQNIVLDRIKEGLYLGSLQLIL
jgi:hypothetical protein